MHRHIGVQTPQQVKARTLGQVDIQQHQIRFESGHSTGHQASIVYRRQRGETGYRVHLADMQGGHIEVIVDDQDA